MQGGSGGAAGARAGDRYDKERRGGLWKQLRRAKGRRGRRVGTARRGRKAQSGMRGSLRPTVRPGPRRGISHAPIALSVTEENSGTKKRIPERRARRGKASLMQPTGDTLPPRKGGRGTPIARKRRRKRWARKTRCRLLCGRGPGQSRRGEHCRAGLAPFPGGGGARSPGARGEISHIHERNTR